MRINASGCSNTCSFFQCGRSPLYMAARGSFIGIVDMIIKAEMDAEKPKVIAPKFKKVRKSGKRQEQRITPDRP